MRVFAVMNTEVIEYLSSRLRPLAARERPAFARALAAHFASPGPKRVGMNADSFSPFLRFYFPEAVWILLTEE